MRRIVLRRLVEEGRPYRRTATARIQNNRAAPHTVRVAIKRVLADG
jgi:hypothetical protein